MTPSVAIVGAGWAGLSAAIRLADAGARVTVFEAARQPGGRARAVAWNGISVDNGQHLLVGAYSASLAIMRHVGVDTDQALCRLPLTVQVPGRLSLRLPKLPAPFHLAVGLLRARGASLAEKISAARFMAKLQAAQFRLSADDSVARWLDANGQRGALRTHLWESLCLAALNTHPAEASAQIFANVLRDTLGSTRDATDMLLPRIDLGRLFPDAALRHLGKGGGKVRLGTRVVAISRCPCSNNDGASGDWKISTANDTNAFDHVVLATAPQHALALLPPATELGATRALINELQWEPIATAYLQYPKNIRLPQPLQALNHGSTQWLADRGQLGGPGGLLAHVLSARGNWERLDNDQLVRTLHDQTNELFQRYSVMPPLPLPQANLVIRERRATFRCVPNQERPSSDTASRGLWLAGDYVASDYPGTLESAVRSGEAVAKGILGSAGQPPLKVNAGVPPSVPPA